MIALYYVGIIHSCCLVSLLKCIAGSVFYLGIARAVTPPHFQDMLQPSCTVLVSIVHYILLLLGSQHESTRNFAAAMPF